MKVRELKRPRQIPAETVRADETLAEAIRRFCRSTVRALVVTEDGRVVGMLAMRDVLNRLEEEGGGALERPVSAAMTREVVTLDPGASLEEAHEVFTTRRLNHLPILDDGGRLLAVLTPADVLAGVADDAAEEREYLHAYIRGALL